MTRPSVSTNKHVSYGNKNRHDGLTLEDENIVMCPYFVKHPWFPVPTKFTPEKYTARAITEYMNLNTIAQLPGNPKLERVLEEGINTAIWSSEVYVEVGILGESETSLTGREQVAEVPKNVVQHRIGIAAVAATAAAATTCTLAAAVAAAAAAELLWRRGVGIRYKHDTGWRNY